MKTTVVSLGGSLIVPDKIDTKLLSGLRKIILARKKEQFIIVCGGGRTCRNYQNAARKLGVRDNIDLDRIGIASTKLNAELVRTVFYPYSYKIVVDNAKKIIRTNKRTIIAYGRNPGFSTDMVCVILAKRFRAKKIINLTNVDYVYDKDPNKFRDAKPVKKISWNDFFRLVGNKFTPGMHQPFDPVASRYAKKSGISVFLVNGRRLGNLKKLLAGKKFKGTVIS